MFAITCLALLCAANPEGKSVPLDEETKAKLQMIAFDAAREGDLKTLKEYFRVGMPAEIITPRGDSLLTLAAYHGHAEAVELIAAQPGVDVSRRNKMGFDPLTGAAYKGHVDVAKTLLKLKANVNSANGAGQTPLMFTAVFGKTEVAQLLLDAGAKLDTKNKEGDTALSLAQKQQNEAMIRLLEKAKK